MKTSLELLLAILFSASLYGQDLHVYYDVFYDSLRYEMEGEEVQRPLVRKSNQVILHVTNYNDYRYRVKVTTEGKDYIVASSGIGQALLGGAEGSKGLGSLSSLLSGGGDILTKLTGGSMGNQGFGGDAEEAEEADLSTEIIDQLESFNAVLEEIQTAEESVRSVNTKLKQELATQQNWEFMYREVNKLQNNTTLAPNKMRSLMIAYLERLLGSESDKEFNVATLLTQAKAAQISTASLDAYAKNIDRLQQKVALAEEVATNLKKLGLPAPRGLALQSKLLPLRAKADTLQKNVGQLRREFAEAGQQSLSSLAELRYLYEEVKDHRFSTRTIITPTKDVTTLKIGLEPVVDSLSSRYPSRSLADVPITTYGGLKINASVGISFASFFNQPQTYLKRDEKIFGDDLDAFSPLVTSFIHFYGESRGQTTLGGTIGIGLNIGNSGGSSGIQNYLFGPSLIIGKGQRIILTTGLFGGKVNRLAEGYRVGDVYNETKIPLKPVYELGAFFGVSFNITGS